MGTKCGRAWSDGARQQVGIDETKDGPPRPDTPVETKPCIRVSERKGRRSLLWRRYVSSRCVGMMRLAAFTGSSLSGAVAGGWYMHAFPVTYAPCVSQLDSAHHCEDPRLAMIREEQNKKYKCPRNGENAGTMHIGYTGPASAQAKNAHTTIWCGVDYQQGPGACGARVENQRARRTKRRHFSLE